MRLVAGGTCQLAEFGFLVPNSYSVLADEEFGDAVHARYRGHLKLHRLNHELALRSLDAMGIPRPMASSR